MQTIARMKAYDGRLASRPFEEIDFKWLSGFEAFLSKTSASPNGRAIHFRNIRAVFNCAIDDEVISCYPFRKFKIKYAPTRKRSLTPEQMRTLIGYPCEEYQEIYRDMFVLMFYLCGVNAVDLLNAKPNFGKREIRIYKGKDFRRGADVQARDFHLSETEGGSRSHESQRTVLQCGV